ncbi:MAG TPA: hypothetical protein VMV47_08345 [Bacteroidales bacterium]|nr:hypothetical protein [Bacteroidales bacterium]
MLNNRKYTTVIVQIGIILISGITQQITAQDTNTELIIEIIQKGSDQNTAAWLHIQTEDNDNFGGWYGGIGPKGFPAFSPVKVKVPAGEVTVTAWKSNCDEVRAKLMITNDKPQRCRLTLKPRFDLHKSEYFSFDSHNHLDGDEEKNQPPYIYPYCAALGIDHLDICQLWNFRLGMEVNYDSILRYLNKNSTPTLNLGFGVESPKLRYGHTWYVNHPGMPDPLGDYLKWHDVDYFESLVSKDKTVSCNIDLRGKLHPKWNPPFIDRLHNRAKGGFSVAAHPTRWWHNGPNEIYPATNTSADLAFDLLAAQSYNGIVVMGDCKDNIFYQNLWFKILNLGYRLTPVAETDGNIANGSMGKSTLTYVWTGDRKFNMNLLIDNIMAGHTMLSGKAVMLLNVDGKLPPGSVLPADGKKHTIRVEVYSEPFPDEYISYLVLYRNGKVAEKLDFREQKRRMIKHQFVVNESETAWYVVKSYGKGFPKNDLQFDVIDYAEKCLLNPDYDYASNTGVSITAPVFFNSPGWEPPEPIISLIHGRIIDQEGHPLKKLLVEIWNVDNKIAELETNDQGDFEIKAPGTIDVRFTLPDGNKEQQWLFYEYPPLLNLIEDTYTISWAKKYHGLRGGQMPWEAFHYNEILEVLKEIHWTIRPNGKIMLP